MSAGLFRRVALLLPPFMLATALVFLSACSAVADITYYGMGNPQVPFDPDMDTSFSELVEEQLIMRGSGAALAGTPYSSGSSGSSGSGVGRGGATGSVASGTSFRHTEEGEPVSIQVFVNDLLTDDEFCKITVHSKTADALGDAGFILEVENRYQPLTPVGRDNYCYITPIIGTWTVNGVKMDPLADGRVYPDAPGTIYLYFDPLNSEEQLINVKGSFELYRISDWWNPVGVYEFEIQ